MTRLVHRLRVDSDEILFTSIFSGSRQSSTVRRTRAGNGFVGQWITWVTILDGSRGS